MLQLSTICDIHGEMISEQALEINRKNCMNNQIIHHCWRFIGIRNPVQSEKKKVNHKICAVLNLMS